MPRLKDHADVARYLSGHGWEREDNRGFVRVWKNPAYSPHWLPSLEALALTLAEQVRQEQVENRKLREKIRDLKDRKG